MKKWFLLCASLLLHPVVLAETQYTAETITLDLPKSWFLGEAVGIVENKNGHRYIFNRGEHALLEFDNHGNFVQEIGHGQFSKPHGLRLDRFGNIWTADAETHLVQRFSPEGKVTLVLGMKNKASEGWFDRDYNLILFNAPHDIAFDRHDNIYVVDKGNARIVKLDPNGLLIKTWGRQGDRNGEFNFAHSIIVDKHERVLVADRENKRIQAFDLDGNYLEQWTNIGYPYWLTLSGDSVWMTDARNETILQLGLDGKVLQSVRGEKGRHPHQFGFVHGLHVTEKQELLTTQVLNWSVVLLKPQ